MIQEAGPPPLRVERALRLLPDVDALAPLRAFLVSNSRVLPSAEPYHTVGKRYLPSRDLKWLVSKAVAQVVGHLAVLYQAAVEALECEERGDLTGAVRAFVRAGEREAGVGREGQAYEWYDHALRLAEELRDRRPEIDTLRHLGRLQATRGAFEEAARFHQRSLALAEAELDHGSAALACQGLGEVAQLQETWQGAVSWYTRGLKYAENDRQLTAYLYLGLGDVARSRGEQDVAADWLRRALELFQELGRAEGIVRSLNAWGLLEALRQRYAEALAYYREALARLPGAGRDAGLEMAIRLNICQLFLDSGRLPDAEDEIRRAEELAIARNLTRPLARLYVVMGKVRGRMGDDSGFVFFEKAVELCRGMEESPRLEAEIYLEYGRFRRELGDWEESRAYLERAREILETLGDGSAVSRVDSELGQQHFSG